MTGSMHKLKHVCPAHAGRGCGAAAGRTGGIRLDMRRYSNTDASDHGQKPSQSLALSLSSLPPTNTHTHTHTH